MNVSFSASEAIYVFYPCRKPSGWMGGGDMEGEVHVQNAASWEYRPLSELFPEILKWSLNLCPDSHHTLNVGPVRLTKKSGRNMSKIDTVNVRLQLVKGSEFLLLALSSTFNIIAYGILLRYREVEATIRGFALKWF